MTTTPDDDTRLDELDLAINDLEERVDDLETQPRPVSKHAGRYGLLLLAGVVLIALATVGAYVVLTLNGHNEAARDIASGAFWATLTGLLLLRI